MNLPNKLTILRMALVPFFVFFTLADFIPHHLLIAGLVFGAASYTDHLDGKIARRDNLITNFGKLMDPLADKIMVMSALVCFVETGFANVWFVLLIMIREFAVTSIRLIAVENGKVIPANGWGKAKTVSQIVAICVIFLLQYVLEQLGRNRGLEHLHLRIHEPVAGEKPERLSEQLRRVFAQEAGRRLVQRAHADAPADDHRVEAADLRRFFRQVAERRAGQKRGKLRRALRRRARFRCVSDQNHRISPFPVRRAVSPRCRPSSPHNSCKGRSRCPFSA